MNSGQWTVFRLTAFAQGKSAKRKAQGDQFLMFNYQVYLPCLSIETWALKIEHSCFSPSLMGGGGNEGVSIVGVYPKEKTRV